MNVLWIPGVVLTCVILVLILRRDAPEFGQLIPIVAAVLLASILLPNLRDITELITAIGESAGVSGESVTRVLKGIGIGLVTNFSVGVCMDCGQRALGEIVEYCGRIATVSLALPIILSFVQEILELSF